MANASLHLSVSHTEVVNVFVLLPMLPPAHRWIIAFVICTVSVIRCCSSSSYYYNYYCYCYYYNYYCYCYYYYYYCCCLLYTSDAADES